MPLRSHRAGLILMLLAAVCIGLQAFFVKLASAYTGPAEIALLRFAASYVIVQMATSAGWITIRLVNWKGVAGRSLFGGVGNLLYFYAITRTELSHAIVLLYTYPIFASLYDHWWRAWSGGSRGAALTLPAAAALLASFAGIGLIVDPTLDALHAGDLLALLSGMLVGGAIVSLRESRKTDSSWTIFHYFNITGILLSLPLVLGHWTMPPWASLPVLLGVLVFSLLGQMGMTFAYRHISTVEGGVLSTAGAAVGAVTGILFFHEAVTAGFLLGSALIILSGLYLTKPAASL
ncbi:MAG TPA: DMT family transporter [Nitrospiria bacterium]|nr:DMT family transporter [Nitrospiria bacterium]